MPFKRYRIPFLLTALGVFALLAILSERQALVGKVPLPAELLGYFPPWSAAHIDTAAHHAEMGDALTLFYPWRHFQISSLRQWTLPLWNPLIMGGAPFLGEPQSALFYPAHLLYLVFSMPTAWTLGVLLNIMLAGAFTAWFVRDLGGSPAGAIAAGVLFSCCGFITAWQLFSPLADAVIWLPFIFFAVQRLCRRPSVPAMLLAAAGFALTVLAGHPESAVHVTLAGAAFALWQCAETGWADGTVGRRVLWFAGAGILALGLTALQLIPTLEWIGYQALSPDLRWPGRSLLDMLSLFSRDVTQTPNSAGLLIPEAASYLAPFALLLAPLAVFFRPRRVFFFFLLVIVVALQVILQIGPAHWAISQIQTLARMKNWRMLLLLDFSLAVLAGIGITVLGGTLPAKAATRRWQWIVPVLGFLGVAAAIYMLHSRTLTPVKWYRGAESSLLFLTAGFLLIAVRLWNRIGGRTFAALALLLLSADMVTFRSGALPFVRRDIIYPDAPLFQFLKSKDPLQYRIAVLDGTMASNFAMMYGVPEIGGYDLELQLAKSFLDDYRNPAAGAINLAADNLLKTDDRRLDLMNVRYFVTTTINASADLLQSRPDRFSLAFSEGPLRVFENRRALDRVRFLPLRQGTIEVIPDMEKQLERLKDPHFDVENSVVLPAVLEGWHSERPPDARAPRPQIDWVSSSPNESVFRVNDSQSGILTVSQIFYAGWRAYVDGREVSVLRANYGMVAIPMIAGGHLVRFVYDPLSFRVGLILTLLTCLTAAGLLIFSVVRPRYRARSQP